MAPIVPPLRGVWLALGLAACAGSAGAPPLPADAPLRPGEVRVRLVFGPEADLDLYVTGPSQETVYYANTPTAAGAALDADRRCEDPSPRVETVSFMAAPAGRYRVGIDFPARCGRSVGPVSYRLLVEAPGRVEERCGRAELGRREPNVLEIEIGR